jgi:hypothetical protein
LCPDASVAAADVTQLEGDEEPEHEEDEDDEEDETPVAAKKKSKKKKPKKKKTAATALAAEDTPSPASSTPKGKGKKGKGGSAPAEDPLDGLDEVDRALAELKLKYGDSPAASAAPEAGPSTSEQRSAFAFRSLLSVEPKNLDADLELRRFFGSKVVSCCHPERDPS